MIFFGYDPYKNCSIKVLYPSPKVNSPIGGGQLRLVGQKMAHFAVTFA
jgi:hypothetical protein